MGMARSRTIVTRIVTTTYASSAAKSTAAPEMPTASRRARWGTAVTATGPIPSPRSPRRRDGDGHVEVGELEEHDGGGGFAVRGLGQRRLHLHQPGRVG